MHYIFARQEASCRISENLQLVKYPMAILWHTMASGDSGQMSTSILELHDSYICGKPFQITHAIWSIFKRILILMIFLYCTWTCISRVFIEYFQHFQL